MRILEFITHSEKETKQKAEELAKKVISQKQQAGAVVICLMGELGSGKTTFVKGFAKGLGVKKIIQSPTFVLVRRYKLPVNSYSPRAKSRGKLQVTSYKLLYHIDAYRLERPKEFLSLGWDEWVRGPHTIILVEWADRIKKILPKSRIEIYFEHMKEENRRRITMYMM